MATNTLTLGLAERSSAKALTLRILDELVESTRLKRLHVRLWDGLYWPDARPREAVLCLKHPGALRSMLLGGTDLAVGEAYLDDHFDIEGNMEAAFELLDVIREQTEGWTRKLKISYLLAALPLPPVCSNSSRRLARLRGNAHSTKRDRDAIAFHYDLSNDFYALWLDPRMVYSCAYFQKEFDDLETAQVEKLDYICRKLGLQAGQKLLDIGCGWGGLIIHAAANFGVKATGITLSEQQAHFARMRIRELGLADHVEVLIQDYRELARKEPFDAMASVGMVEHVGAKNLPIYFKQAYQLLRPGGVFLNHGITLGSIPLPNQDSFMQRYVFPDTDLLPLDKMLKPAEDAGFEVRDVENLREHYAKTLDHWVARLEAHHDDALQYITEPVYRIWRAYMAGSSHGFRHGHLSIYQTLLVKLDDSGSGSWPLTRARWYSRC